MRLELNEERFQSIGVDIQNWETQVALGTAAGRIVRAERFRTPQDPEETLDRIATTIGGILGSLAEPPVGIGVSTRGLVDSRRGISELGSNPAWVHIEIGDYLASRSGLRVYVENNVRAAAVGRVRPWQHGCPRRALPALFAGR